MNQSEVGDALIFLNVRFFDLWLLAHKDNNQPLIDALWMLAENAGLIATLDAEADGQADEIEDLHNQLRKANLEVVAYMEQVRTLKFDLEEKDSLIARLKEKLSIFMDESEIEEI